MNWKLGDKVQHNQTGDTGKVITLISGWVAIKTDDGGSDSGHIKDLKRDGWRSNDKS